MKNIKLLSVPLLSAVILLSGCAPDVGTGVSVPLPHAKKAPPPVEGHDDGNKTSPIVTRDNQIKKDITVTAVIDSTGGVMSIPAAGAVLRFEPGAVSRPTTITFTALKGNAVAYDFAPHGIVFSAPVTLIQDMTATSLKTSYDSAQVIHGAYIPDGAADIDQTTNSATVTDSYNAWTDFFLDSADVVHLNNSKFVIPHFSGYILSGGRR